jgi:hypothetical protein
MDIQTSDGVTKEAIRKLADYAESKADEAMTMAVSWTIRSGPQSAEVDLIKAGALYRARDVLRENL